MVRPVSRSHTFSVLSKARGNRPLPVRCHSHADDSIGMALQRAQGAAGVQVPHLQRVVRRRGHRPPPVRRHRHAIDRSTSGLPACGAPDRCPGPTPLACWSSRRGNRAPPVRRHRHVHDSTRVAFQRAQLLVRSPDPTPSACWSQDAETARCPSAVTATPLTTSEWPVQRAQGAASLQIPHLQRVCPQTRKPPASRPASPPRQRHEPRGPPACAHPASRQIPHLQCVAP